MKVARLPYAGNSGWSGSGTSRVRALEADKTGRTRDRQRTTRQALRQAGYDGITWKELSDITGWHHGTSSGVLSVLHKTGDIARLSKVRRDKCAVYVMPRHVQGRPTAAQGRKNPVAEALTAWLGTSKADRDPEGFVRAMREASGIQKKRRVVRRAY